VARLQLSPQLTRVSEVMTRNLITVTPTDRTRFCMQLMIEKNLRHLPVLEDGKLVGLLSIRDLVKDVVAEQEGLINHLEQYIRGA
jgi:CBS domain-containing protein